MEVKNPFLSQDLNGRNNVV